MADLSDAQVSRLIACEAGQLLLALRESAGQIAPDDRAGADALRKTADRESHLLIMRLLAEHRPDDAVLSEEGKDSDARLGAARCWIVDPLDGTWEYGLGRPDFAVHVALWDAAAKRLEAGTVDLPAQGLTRSVLDEIVDQEFEATDRPVRIVASRTRPPAVLPAVVALLTEQLGREVEVVDVGSVGAKVNEILCGRADAYVHDTGFYEWDVAAPYSVARHQGLVASHVDGRDIDFNCMPPYVTDLLVGRRWLAERIRPAYAAASSSAAGHSEADGP